MEICRIVLPYNVGLFSLSPLHHSIKKKHSLHNRHYQSSHFSGEQRLKCETDVQAGSELQAKKKNKYTQVKRAHMIKFQNQKIYSNKVAFGLGVDFHILCFLASMTFGVF